MPVIEHAVIAAAGIGSRLGFGTPKCLIEYEGKTLLGHLLERLAEVPDVRICVGFMREEVVAEAIKHRPDVIFVINHAFRSTTTLTSYVMGARGVDAPVLYMDADIYFQKSSFRNFLEQASQTTEPLIAITPVKTEHCVYTHLDEAGDLIGFSRTEPSSTEWANLCWLPKDTIIDGSTAVFEQLSNHLPMRTCIVESFEVDTLKDLEILRSQREDQTG